MPCPTARNTAWRGRPQVDYAAAKDHVHDVIAQIAPVDSVERFEGLGVHVIQNSGALSQRPKCRLAIPIIEARRFVVARALAPLCRRSPVCERHALHQRKHL